MCNLISSIAAHQNACDGCKLLTIAATHLVTQQATQQGAYTCSYRMHVVDVVHDRMLWLVLRLVLLLIWTLLIAIDWLRVRILCIRIVVMAYRRMVDYWRVAHDRGLVNYSRGKRLIKNARHRPSLYSLDGDLLQNFAIDRDVTLI